MQGDERTQSLLDFEQELDNEIDRIKRINPNNYFPWNVKLKDEDKKQRLKDILRGMKKAKKVLEKQRAKEYKRIREKKGINKVMKID